MTLLLFAGAQGLADCEPADVFAKLEQAQTARASDRLDDAYLTVQRVLRQDQTNLHARLVLALVRLDQSRAPVHPQQNLRNSAINSLAFTANSLQDYANLQSDKRCPENRDLYSVFDTLGIEYFKSGDKIKSERAFLRGERNIAALSPEDQSKLLFNLGLYYKARLNLDKAVGYFERAQKAHNPAAANQIEALRGLQSLAK